MKFKKLLTKTLLNHLMVTKSLVASEEMLSFSSDKEMYETAAMLSEMSKNDLNTWYNSKNSNFKSIEQIYREAINEFEEFGNLEIPDFKVAEEIKDKYRDILLFNNNPKDEELYAPLLPISNPFYSYVCNKDGNVIIGGNVKNLIDTKSFEETRYFKTFQSINTKSIEEKENYIWILDGKRKMWVDVISLQPYGAIYFPVCALKLEARKKNWLGWCSYATTYSFLLVEHLSGYREGTFLGDTGRLNTQNTFTTSEHGSGYEFKLACYNGNAPVRGKIRISSRGTGGQSAVLTINKSYR